MIHLPETTVASAGPSPFQGWLAVYFTCLYRSKNKPAVANTVNQPTNCSITTQCLSGSKIRVSTFK